MRLMPAACLALLLPMALLAACGDDAATTDDARAASGEVLEGTISDAMLPLASVRSQPPLLPSEQQDDGRTADASRPRSDAAATPAPAGESDASASDPAASEAPAEGAVAE